MQTPRLQILAAFFTGIAILTFPAIAPAQVSEGIAFLGKTEAGKLFPKQLLEYKLKDLKIKKKSDDWQEYSATYKTSKSSPKELKLVINDVLLNGSEDWEIQRGKSEETIQGHPLKVEKGDDKHTVMVFVGDRFRVDFKSREISPEKLRAMAGEFDFKPVDALAPKPSGSK